MAKKNIKTLGRRGLALLLTLVMMTGLLQINAFAYKNQVMDGSFTIDAEGNVGTTEATSVTESGYTLSKTIRQTGKDAFEITLQVETSQTVVSSDAAVQLVIDTSSSMQYCATCGKHKGNGFGERCTERNHTENRLDAIKEILTENNGFLDSLTAANSGKVFVSVVSYGQGATTNVDWVDIKVASNLNTVKAAINGLTATDNATNTHAGLMLARNRLDMNAVSGVAAKFTVLLSDGFANCVGAESTSTSSIRLSGRAPSDASATTGGTNGAKAMAAAVAGKSTVYAVGYGVDKEYLSDIIGSEENVFTGADSAAVTAAFANIAQAAVSGMNGAGSSVTDPMGDYIVLGDVSGLAGVSASNGTITWKLEPENAVTSVNGSTTTYKYSITYPITLDTAARGFEEVDESGATKYYPTNGYTYLSAKQADGSAKQIAFPIPGVCGEIPEAEWKIEYYLQDNAAAGDYDSYKLDETEERGEAEIWSTVNAPEGYAEKYAREYYKFVAGDVKLEVTPDGENVMRLYYDCKTSQVTVNHYYKTDRITAEGVSVYGAYPEVPDKTSQATAKVMSDYTAVPELAFNQAMYELDHSDPLGCTTRVQENAELNVINIYYTRLVDERAVTSAKVLHVYTTYGYELNDGKYELVEIGQQTETAENAVEIRATTVFDVSEQPLDGYEGFALNTEKGDYEDLLQENGKLSFVVADAAESNVRTLHFEKIVDERIPVDVVVNHYYTKTVTAIVDGEVVATTEPDGELGESVTVPAYAGEKFEAVEINAYEGDVYVSDSGNADKLVIESVGVEGASIDLYYSLTVVPEKTEIVANHIYRTVTEVTVELTAETTDEEGNPVVEVIGTTTETVVEEVHRIDGQPVSLYVGQRYTAPKQAWSEGFVYNESESNDTGIGGTDYVLDLYYDYFADADERAAAEIEVQHNYVTRLTTIVDGAVETVSIPDGSVTESFPAEGEDLRAGDEFTAVSAPVYNENTYVQLTEEALLGPVVLQPGTNDTIVINYERGANDLVETAYEVNYEYRTYAMTVVDGVAAYGEPSVESGETVSGSGYVGQKIVLEDGAREGFAAYSAPAAEQILAAEGNSWTFVYERYIPLEKGFVVVNHYYSLETVAIDGTSSWSSSVVSGTPVEKYLGESYAAEPVLNGYEKLDATLDAAAFAAPYELTVSGDHVVEFHYKKVVNNSIRAPYSITHKYFLYDWDGSLISESASEPQTGVGFVTNTITVAPETTDYTLISATYNGESMDGNYTVTLQEGSNDVVFVYEKQLERDKVDVTVIHNYYKDAAAVTAEDAEPQSSYTETAAGIEEETVYTASVRDEAGYVFHSADPESCSIVVKDEGENVIILNYVRTAGRPPVNPTPDPDPVDPEPKPEPQPEPEVPEIEIPEEEIPLADVPVEEVVLSELIDEEVPLADVPKTGDMFSVWAAISGLSLAGLGLLEKKRREDEEN